ncbi:VRR-NUC domain-containing protein [Actinobaculum sp. 352]|uniref:VRR-NUC domain-containing protein n=1 Tax=Actinobaculum sp. 352 TaxID=2490946 RepID=UPI000F7EAAD2|nr:VRR-NUC domain-containing protein [Actinobaculum sp. 352]RTE49624.1 VRR-NUC domain-containing protein [Actinobaculum sp. 352]
MRERDLESQLVTAVKNAGGIAPKWTSPGLDGVPDRIILLPGGLIAFVELKAPGQTPRPLQHHRLHQLQTLGFTATWINHPNQIPTLLNQLLESGH